MKTGITGLPYSGKTTLFCALTGQDYESLPHGKDIHLGTVRVPDERLDRLYEMFKPKKKTLVNMEYFDVKGHTSGQSKTMEPKELQAFKNANSLILVLDAFNEGANPRGDFDSIIEEFALNDLVVVTNRLDRLEKELRSGKHDEQVLEKAILEKCRDTLESEGVLGDLKFGHEEEKVLKGFQFLSLKPLLIVINISEAALLSGVAGKYEKQFDEISNTVCTSICTEIEMEIALLDVNDRPAFLESMGIKETALEKVIRLSYESLGLISFFTAGGTDEVRAWTVRKGTPAPECAGVIHSDMERGFIRAEVVSFDDLMSSGSFKAAREKGLLRIEGKSYVVQDGDIATILFNV
ncbi:MAG: redox-regulated ATPase YchF [Candidatus Latescibacteria bacterium]|jgi:ribosome-binding ATPase|nr:redox-regulated ATPase YchF [Candidatus Latescibacterota bacterium]